MRLFLVLAVLFLCLKLQSDTIYMIYLIFIKKNYVN